MTDEQIQIEELKERVDQLEVTVNKSNFSAGVSWPLPTIDEAGIIAVNMSEHLSALEQANFVAGFQECLKYLMQGERKAS